MTSEPEGPARHPALSPEDRRKVARAAALRPMGLLMLVIGCVAFISTLEFWLLPLTLATYAALFALTYRDPIFRRRTLEKGRATRISPGVENENLSPEHRARGLLRGETRQRVEEALSAHRKVVAAIEESDGVTRAVLDGVVPKLRATADRIVDAAHRRDTAAAEIESIKRRSDSSETGKLEEEIRVLDAELSDMAGKMPDLRARVVRISISETSEARVAAREMDSSIRELNHRLDILSKSTPPEDREPEG